MSSKGDNWKSLSLSLSALTDLVCNIMVLHFAFVQDIQPSLIVLKKDAYERQHWIFMVLKDLKWGQNGLLLLVAYSIVNSVMDSASLPCTIEFATVCKALHCDICELKFLDGWILFGVFDYILGILLFWLIPDFSTFQGSMKSDIMSKQRNRLKNRLMIYSRK